MLLIILNNKVMDLTSDIVEKPPPTGKTKGSSNNKLSDAAATSHQNGPTLPGTGNKSTDPTWVHEIFQGTLTNETRCLNCETVSSF